MSDYLTVRHETRDFDAWKRVFDTDAANRTAAGLTDIMCVRGAENPNLVGLIFAVADRGKAEAMMQSAALRGAMEQAGVVGAPVATFRRGEVRPKAAQNYLTAAFKVTGFDTFQRGYAMDAADRKAAGLTEVALLQNADDPNALFLIFALDDVARAKAFLTSPKLAEHQVKNAGMVGQPDARFWTAA